jgi:hypothetical protein
VLVDYMPVEHAHLAIMLVENTDIGSVTHLDPAHSLKSPLDVTDRETAGKFQPGNRAYIKPNTHKFLDVSSMNPRYPCMG